MPNRRREGQGYFEFCHPMHHPSGHKVPWITATSGSILEVYRQLLA